MNKSICIAIVVVGWIALQPGSMAYSQNNISVSNTSKFVGNGRWNWTVFLQAPAAVLKQIRCVEYTLHPTFPNPVRPVCKRGTDSQAFALSSNGWGTFTIATKVFFLNGNTQQLNYNLKFVAGAAASAPSCKTQVNLTIAEGTVRRLKGGSPDLAVYAAGIHKSLASNFYVVNSGKLRTDGIEKFTEKDFVGKLRSAGIGEATKGTVDSDTYRKVSLASGKAATLDFPGGKLGLSLSNPEQNAYADIAVCLP